jgi:hypothetical protein
MTQTDPQNNLELMQTLHDSWNAQDWGTTMSTLRRILATACMLCLFTLVGSPAGAQIPDGDWLTYNRSLAGDRFSPLKEINRSNVAQLKAICTYTLPEVSSLQTGPLVIGRESPLRNPPLLP